MYKHDKISIVTQRMHHTIQLNKCVCACVCMCMRVRVHVRMCTYACVCLCVHVCVPVYMCVCVCAKYKYLLNWPTELYTDLHLYTLIPINDSYR